MVEAVDGGGVLCLTPQEGLSYSPGKEEVGLPGC